MLSSNENLFASTGALFAKTLQHLDKKNVKKLVEPSLDWLFDFYRNENQHLKKSVEFVLKEFARLIGYNILRGRIEGHDSNLLNTFESMNL